MTAQLKVVGTGLETGNMDRQKALEAALAQIDRAFGKGSAMKLGSREKIEIDTISTGSLGLDIALGVGGLPRGRVVEIYGPESSGKTTLALHAIAEAQRGGGRGRTRRIRTPDARWRGSPVDNRDTARPRASTSGSASTGREVAAARRCRLR